MSALNLRVEGIGVWSPQLADFSAWRDLLAGEVPATTHARPPALVLSPHERRRAPHSVLVAIEVASQAVAMSGRAASSLACIFASAYGDQATTDYLCRVLARVPIELSPTRFHHSVHNVAAGYWTIATHCRAPSSATCAGDASFGAALLETVVLACADNRPVLLVCSDDVGTGPLGELTGCTQAFGSAWVLSPAGNSNARLRVAVTTCAPRHPVLPAPCRAWMQGNPATAALPLLTLLARGGGDCVLALSAQLGLHVGMETKA
jgi:hypothetical protein